LDQEVGDSEAKNGSGDSYSTFICDQGVVNESLQIRELTKFFLPLGYVAQANYDHTDIGAVTRINWETKGQYVRTLETK